MSQSRTTLDRDERVVVTGVRRAPAPMGDVRWNDASTDVGVSSGRDRVRWGPILAGVLAALTTMLLLGLLGLAAGLTAVDARQASTSTGTAGDAGRNALIWSAVTALISFFVGGYVASKATDIRDRNWGAMNGALVFLAALPIMLWLAA